MVSNRGPIEHWFDDAGRIRRRDAAGGVATALSSVARQQPVTWIASAGTDADRAIAILGQRSQIGRDSDLRLLDLPAKAYNAYYGTFCNPILWFVQHSIGERLHHEDLATATLDAWDDGYQPINETFAAAVIDEIDGDGSDFQVMLHDYHLYLAPRLIRAAKPRAALQHFIHIPWPGPAAWRQLPDLIVRRLCAGLLANDSVVFQTEASVSNFLATCKQYLSAAKVMERQGQVEYLGQTTFVWSNPVSLDTSDLMALRAQPIVEQYRRELAARDGMQTIVRVDRLDPSKNIADGFEAYGLMLERNPRLHGKVRFIAHLVPSRENVIEYAAYKRRVFELIDGINRKYGTPGLAADHGLPRAQPPARHRRPLALRRAAGQLRRGRAEPRLEGRPRAQRARRRPRPFHHGRLARGAVPRRHPGEPVRHRRHSQHPREGARPQPAREEPALASPARGHRRAPDQRLAQGSAT